MNPMEQETKAKNNQENINVTKLPNSTYLSRVAPLKGHVVYIKIDANCQMHNRITNQGMHKRSLLKNTMVLLLFSMNKWIVHNHDSIPCTKCPNRQIHKTNGRHFHSRHNQTLQYKSHSNSKLIPILLILFYTQTFPLLYIWYTE